MLESRLPEIIVEIKTIVDEEIARGAETVVEDARTRLEPHRLSGRLEEGLHTEKEPEGVYVIAGGRTEKGDDVFWGHMLEHGTSHSPPFPFLVPALDDNRDGIVKRVRVGLGKL